MTGPLPLSQVVWAVAQGAEEEPYLQLPSGCADNQVACNATSTVPARGNLQACSCSSKHSDTFGTSWDGLALMWCAAPCLWCLTRRGLCAEELGALLDLQVFEPASTIILRKALGIQGQKQVLLRKVELLCKQTEQLIESPGPHPSSEPLMKPTDTLRPPNNPWQQQSAFTMFMIASST